MKLRQRILGSFGAAALIVAATASGVMAAPIESQQTAQVEVVAGGLSGGITYYDFADVPFSLSGQYTTGYLVGSVTDMRGTQGGWSISMTGNPLQSTTLSPQITLPPPETDGPPSASWLTWTLDSQPLTGAPVIANPVTYTTGAGGGSGSYTLTIPIKNFIPGQTLADIYTSTAFVTLSDAP